MIPVPIVGLGAVFLFALVLWIGWGIRNLFRRK